MLEYKVKNLKEYFEAIDASKQSPKELLWFRGQENKENELLPSLYRYTDIEDWSFGNEIHMREDIRLHHYNAKNHAFLSNSTSFGKYEIMTLAQHYSMRTRLLDWSESAIHAMIFALESWIDPSSSGHNQKMNTKPGVWLLKPQKLNSEVLQWLSSLGDYPEIIETMGINSADYKPILEEYCNNAHENSVDNHRLNKIYDLSMIEKTVDQILHSSRIIHHKPFTVIQLLIYFYYLEAIKVIENPLPLSVIAPYSSERIRAQHGAFTIFPLIGNEEDTMRQNEIKKISLEKKIYEIPKLGGRIHVTDPEQLTQDLRSIGANRSWLYPEHAISAGELEII